MIEKNKILNYLKEFKNSPDNRLFLEIGLFGSYAKNEADSFSDIDIAVRVDKEYLKTHDIWDYFDAINEIKKSLLQQFHLKSDVFDLDSSSVLVERIQKDIIYV